MSGIEDTAASDSQRFGLCNVCRHARRIRSGRGSTFLRCGLSDVDPAYQRYPPIPVTQCAGHAPRDPAGPTEAGKSFK